MVIPMHPLTDPARTMKIVTPEETAYRFANPTWNYYLNNVVQFHKRPYRVIGVGREGVQMTVHLVPEVPPSP
jgi:hypothetical protein